MAIFTPMIAEGAEGDFRGFQINDLMSDGRLRLRTEIDEHKREQWNMSRGIGLVLTDEITGIRFYARPAPCGLGCHCAAEIHKVVENPNTNKEA